MAAELKAASGGLSRGWGKAWVFPHGLFLDFPRPHSDEVAHAAPSALWFRKCQFTSPFVACATVLPSPTLNRVGMGLMLFPRRN